MMTIMLNSLREKIRNKTIYVIGSIGILIITFLMLNADFNFDNKKNVSFEEMIPIAIIMVNFIASLLAVMLSLETIPTFIHFEFQTSNRKNDLPRFLAYDANSFYKERKLVNTIVVYSAGINEKNINTNLKAGSIDYNIKSFFMNNLNGDERYNELKNKVEKGEPLTKYDLLNLVFFPIMNSKKDKKQRIIDSILMAKTIEDEDIQMSSLALLYAFAEKFVDINSGDKIKEVFRMTLLGKLLKDEGREEGIEVGIEVGIEKGIEVGIEKGREEGRQTLVFSAIKLLTRRFGILPKDIKEKINASQIEELEMIVEGIFDFEKLEDIFKYLNLNTSN